MSAGQTLNDRILAARHSIAGQGLAKAVCKATTEELIGPKRKHLDYLLCCTEEPNVSIPTLANLLLERTQNQNWIVVFKSLVTLHHLMCYGNERFTQYLASSNCTFQLSGFLDKTANAQVGSFTGYDMSPFVRRYAKYLGAKALSYRSVAFDFCKAKRGKESGTLRLMQTDKLLKALPCLQHQVDTLLEFDATTQDLNNGVINAAFMLLFRDLIRLFACYNDGIINLLEKYFDMNKKNARDALDIYKRFLVRMDRVAEFLKVAERCGIDKSDIPDLAKWMGIDKGDIPDLAKAPSSLLEALEAHLASLEGRKPPSSASTPTNNGRVNVASAVESLSSTSSAFGSAANSSQIDDKMQQQLLAEEEQIMAKFKQSKSPTSSPFSMEEPTSATSASFESSKAADSFFDDIATSRENSKETKSASADLLQLAGNPFSSVINSNEAFGGGSSSTTTNNNNNKSGVQQPFATAFDDTAFSNGLNGNSSPFVPSALDNTTGTSFPQYGVGGNALGTNFFNDILQPQAQTTNNNNNNNNYGGSEVFGFGFNNNNNTNKNLSGEKLVSGDLDSSLANLTSNLDLTTTTKNPVGVVDRPRGPPMMSSSGFGFANTQSQLPTSQSQQSPPSLLL